MREWSKKTGRQQQQLGQRRRRCRRKRQPGGFPSFVASYSGGSRDRVSRSIFLRRSRSPPLSSISFSLSLWKQGGYRVLFPSKLPPLPSSHRGGHVTPALLPPTPVVAVAVTAAAATAAAHGLLPGSRAALPASLRLSVCPSSPWCCRENSRSRHQARCTAECPLSLSSESAAEAPAYFSTG